MRRVEKVIIVEGRSDKQKVAAVLNEPVVILCTNGTISDARLEEWADELEGYDVYLLADADEAGEKLRRQFRRMLPEAEHLYIDRAYREVAAAPIWHLAQVLLRADFDVRIEWLMRGRGE
ncbi:toprim domain-containing protein [Geobacillus sp. TFV-3]|uniref:toprim domain-containing protein n=1 Tax=Geobacillus sp. TFV-3 TaxID=1897059 RepID=UPI001356E177|nr:toprim domain-containing protein [Geobacillus sp. TFV-3]KAF0996325.1 Ribonuclease M5 [Geobacillus sp. TFV-3]